MDEVRFATLAQMERCHILQVFRSCEGHRVRTAKALGIGVRTLTDKLRRYGVPPRGKALPADEPAPAR
jgi:DNA-binding NtrC family response regulator